MTIDDINKKLRGFIREMFGMAENAVRPANKKAPTGKQSEQFATVLITTVEQIGQDDRTLKDQAAPSLDVDETITGHRRITASVQFFRGDAFTKACRLQALPSLSSEVAKLQAIGLGLIRTSTAKNLTAVVDADFEQRGQVDLEFYVVAKESQALPTYGHFPITVTTESSTTSSEVTAP